jgi:hypothetical protein
MRTTIALLTLAGALLLADAPAASARLIDTDASRTREATLTATRSGTYLVIEDAVRDRVIKRLRVSRNAYEVAITSRNHVAWLVGSKAKPGHSRVSTLFVWRRGGTPHVRGRGEIAFVSSAGPRAFLIYEPVGGFEWVQAEPVPIVDRCPHRGYDRVVVDDGRFRVTALRVEASNGGEDVSLDIWRACDHTTGRERRLISASASYDSYFGASLAAHAGRFIAVRESSGDRYGSSNGVELFDLQTGSSRGANFGDAIRSPAPVVLTASGTMAVAAQQYAPEGDHYRTDAVLQGVKIDRTFELDRAEGSPDGITDVTVEGNTIRWLHDGESRSYDAN